MTLPEKLKAARQRLGITQRDAAKICGVSLRAYGQWEGGASTLPVTLEGAVRRLEEKLSRSGNT